MGTKYKATVTANVTYVREVFIEVEDGEDPSSTAVEVALGAPLADWECVDENYDVDDIEENDWEDE